MHWFSLAKREVRRNISENRMYWAIHFYCKMSWFSELKRFWPWLGNSAALVAIGVVLIWFTREVFFEGFRSLPVPKWPSQIIFPRTFSPDLFDKVKLIEEKTTQTHVYQVIFLPDLKINRWGKSCFWQFADMILDKGSLFDLSFAWNVSDYVKYILGWFLCKKGPLSGVQFPIED